jgi:hypothetical protein
MVVLLSEATNHARADKTHFAVQCSGNAYQMGFATTRRSNSTDDTRAQIGLGRQTLVHRFAPSVRFSIIASGKLADLIVLDNTAPGNEAILHCSDGRYCCDGNRSGNCCNSDDDTSFFDLPDGRAVATILSMQSLRSSTSSSLSLFSSSTSAGSSTTGIASITSTLVRPIFCVYISFMLQIVGWLRNPKHIKRSYFRRERI